MSLCRFTCRRSELAVRLFVDDEELMTVLKSMVERSGLRLYFLLGDEQAMTTTGIKAMTRDFQDRIITVVSIDLSLFQHMMP